MNQKEYLEKGQAILRRLHELTLGKNLAIS